MATKIATRTQGGGATYRHVWSSLANGDDGAPVTIPGAPDRTVQVFGTFGSSGTIIFEGTLTATPGNWFPLVDPQGNAISFGSAGGELVLELVAHIRPRVTNGDGTTDLTAIVFSGSKKS